MKGTHNFAGCGRIESFGLLILSIAALAGVQHAAGGSQNVCASRSTPGVAASSFSGRPVTQVAPRKELWTDQGQGSSRMDRANPFFVHAKSTVCVAEGRGRWRGW